ncbi:hypothetical protein ACH5RR_029140 [Cinchona calisaya]|uniref:Uncharacterized protein n=1 Tax=Cinchona calisaya TaxID=153742 RepID=A0ABD2YU90_9GENT
MLKESIKRIPYALAIGSIMYDILYTRSDVSYTLNVTSKSQSNLGSGHRIAVKNILKYLRRTKDLFLIYGGQELKICGYRDASFQSEKDDSKSQSGYAFTLNGGTASWKSSKQYTTVDSTTEAKYIAISEAATKAVCIRKFVAEPRMFPSISGPIILYCDNNGVIAQAKEPKSHERSNTCYGTTILIREIIDRNQVKIEKIPTYDNIADPFTKALFQEKHESHVNLFSLKHMNDWL